MNRLLPLGLGGEPREARHVGKKNAMADWRGTRRFKKSGE